MINDLDVIISNAASVLFDVPIGDTIKTNYLGPLFLLNIAKKCKKEVVFTHVSTAYTNSHKPFKSLIPEAIIEEQDPDEIVESIMK